MEPIKIITGRAVVMPKENIDTDQIIPARFLKGTDKNGLGDYLFYDWRYDAQGNPKSEFILNQQQGREAKILIAGDNFGCGSSREHAPWSLVSYGFTAVISTSFADIFRNNALKNSLIPIVVPAEIHIRLIQSVTEKPEAEWVVDLEKQTVLAPDMEPVTFPLEPFSKNCLLSGVDEMGYILKKEGEINRYEMTHDPKVHIGLID